MHADTFVVRALPKGTVFRLVQFREPDVSEEHVASISRIEE
jgi:hypothetical protein